MPQSIIDFINAEYQTNVKKHQEQAQPFIDFLQKSIEYKYKQEELAKVRGKEVETYEQRYRLLTGEEEFKIPEKVIPKVYTESALTKWELKSDILEAESAGFQRLTDEPDIDYVRRFKVKQPEIERVTSARDKAQREYGHFYTEAEKTAEKGEDPDITISRAREAKEKWEAEEKIKEKKPITKWQDELTKMGALSYAEKRLDRKVTEEEAKNIVSKIASEQVRFQEMFYGDEKVSLQKITAKEQFKKALKKAGDKTPEQIDKEIEEKQTILDKTKRKGILGIDIFKKDRIPKEEQEKLASEIEILKESKKYREYLDNIFGETKPEEKIEEKVEPEIEDKINEFMKVNNITDRNEAIKILKEHGVL